jgi:hypothetical protein
MMGTPANCPAEVRLVIEIKRVSQMLKPCPREKIPKAKDTER